MPNLLCGCLCADPSCASGNSGSGSMNLRPIDSTRPPVTLCILDGWGIRRESAGNAPLLARTPVFDRLARTSATAQLTAHGTAVGLPDGNMGNSEVGHLHIGAGRVVMMDIRRIDRAIEDGSFRARPPLTAFVERIREQEGRAHIVGLIGDAGVHGLSRHLLACVHAVAGGGIGAELHLLTDGRDTPPGTAAEALAAIEDALPPRARIATVGGRYFAMDRDRRWDRTARAFRAIAIGEGAHAASAAAAVAAAWRDGLTDEFILPTVIGDYRGLMRGDGLLMTNFRSDRARQIIRALADPSFDEFDRGAATPCEPVLGMVDYFEQPDFPIGAVFARQIVENGLGHRVAEAGIRQLRLAETEKFPHVTYFLNGGCETPCAGEDRQMAASPQVPTYDLKPAMAAREIAENYLTSIERRYGLTVVNFANPDMVGHTGCLEAAIRACEEVDHCLGLVLEGTDRAGGVLLVTADHGNCELMIDPVGGGPHTAHTTNPVPVMLHGGSPGARLRRGALTDLAPTILELMGLEMPPEMTGQSLILHA